MGKLHHVRLSVWLAALLVALWPAAAIRACCCATGPMPTSQGDCPSGCCAPQSDADLCCHPGPSAPDHERRSCGCGPACGPGEVRAKLTGTFDTSAPSTVAALAGDGSLITVFPAIDDLETGFDRPDISTRPKRILYAVWRN